MVSCIPKMENSRNKWFTSFKLCALLCSTWPQLGCEFSPRALFPCCVHYPPGSHWVDVLVIRVVISISRGREGEKAHIHITLITMYCFSSSILLLVTVINLLLCLIYRLNFIRGMYVQENKTVYTGFCTVCSFRHPVGVLEPIPADKEEYCKRSYAW